MQLASNSEDPGNRAFQALLVARNTLVKPGEPCPIAVKVKVDGVFIDQATYIDTDRGCVDRFAMHSDGTHHILNDELVRERVWGKVEVVLLGGRVTDIEELEDRVRLIRPGHPPLEIAI